jgi:hypothetical protein
MSRHTYPLVRRSRLVPAWVRLSTEKPHAALKCGVTGCREHARYEVFIATSPLRSEDEQAQACPNHQGATHELLTGLAKNKHDNAQRQAKAAGSAS